MSSFLTLCQEFASEVGIPGGVPATVVSQTGELAEVVRMVRNADQDIKRRWFDWKFLWATATDTTALNLNTLTTLQKPADIGTYNLDSFWLDKSTASAVHLVHVDYEYYRDTLKIGTQTSSKPYLFTTAPNKNILLWPQSDSASYSLTYEYWIAAAAMTADVDVSAIPTDFHRIIIARAKIFWGDREDAPEVVAGAGAEFDDLMDKLEAREGPEQSGRRLFNGYQGEARVYAG